MASSCPPCFLRRFLLLLLLRIFLVVFAPFVSAAPGGEEVGSGDRSDPFSILSDEFFWHDYSPPSPPSPPSPEPPDPPSVSCETDLGGTGDFDTLCQLHSPVSLTDDLFVRAKGSLVVYPEVVLGCPQAGCMVHIDLAGGIELRRNAKIVAGSVRMGAVNLTLAEGTEINTTALGGDPPPQTSGVPSGANGDGGGHGGRGASCFVRKGQTQEDSWGGDAYSWSTLTKPDSYGSKGSSTSREKDYAGGGGGRVYLIIKDVLEVNGSIMAEGGNGGPLGGGGSGGSIYINATKMRGSGKISASGGDGLAGGGGGRVSIVVYSRHDDPHVFVHGGRSFGCPENAGAAGTLYDAVPKSLTVSNHNLSTQTDTLLLEFPYQPLWTNVFIKNCAKVAVPLLWSRVQVQGQLSLLCGGILTFGLTHYPYSEFELMAEELLMSDSVIKVFGALRMSVKMLLMWDSKMLIHGGADTIVATSLLEASNLIVLKESSMIHSNANLGVHGQGLLNLSGPGDTIEAQRLILSLFYSIQVRSLTA